MSDFKKQIEEDIADYAEKYPNLANIKKPEWAFNFWVLDKLFSEDEQLIEEKIVDYDDKGIDCYVWHEDMKDLYLIQNKFYSEGRDYLFIVMPDDNTENVENLWLVKKVESLIKNTELWKEVLTPDIEEEMFGDSQYLMNNTFSTGHQSVNVYGLPEKYYEVRTEDNAVDIQIHKETHI